MRRAQLHDERGVAMVLFAVVLPLILILTTIAWDAGSWWVHRKHLQTKVDAAAFAGGGAWSIPCASDSDTNAAGTGIVDQAREYVGPHMGPGNQDFTTGTTFNPQVGEQDPCRAEWEQLVGRRCFPRSLGQHIASQHGADVSYLQLVRSRRESDRGE